MKKWVRSLSTIGIILVMLTTVVSPAFAAIVPDNVTITPSDHTTLEASAAPDETLADEKDTVTEPITDVDEPNAALEDSLIDLPIITQADIQAMSDAFVPDTPDNALSEVEQQAIVQTAMEAIGNGIDPASWAKWGAKKLITAMMGMEDADPNAQDVNAKLDQVIAQQEELARRIAQIDGRIVQADVIKNLNDFMKLDWNGEAQNYHRALRSIDQDLEKGTISEADAVAKRKAVLVYTINNTPQPGAPSGALSDFDKNAYTYGSYLLQPMNVLFGSGTANLFEMNHQLMKYKHHWEHQAYEEWASFQNYAIGRYLSVSALNRLSLMARIQAIDEWNAAHPDQTVDDSVLQERFKMLDEQIEQVKQLFEESKVVERADNVRYYQYPGHELLVYTQASKQNVPIEPNPKVGIEHILNPHLAPGDGKPQGIGEIDNYILPLANFWKPFTHYNGKTNLVEHSWLKQVYDDYSGQKNLYDIFFSAEEGGLTAPDGANKDWDFGVNPSKEHPLRLWDGGLFRADRVYTPIVKSATGQVEDRILYYYHSYSNNPHYGNDTLGIGVAPDGVGAVDTETIVAGSIVTIDEITADTTNTTQTGTEQNKTSNKSPSTGVEQEPSYLVAVLLLGAAGLTGMVFRRRWKK